MSARAARAPLRLPRALAGVAAWALLSCGAAAAPATVRLGEPSIGYAYPAGGQAGTTVRVSVGGQFLRGVREARVSGTGLSVRVLGHLPPFKPLDGEEARELRRRLEERRAALLRSPAAAEPGSQDPPPTAPAPTAPASKRPSLPDHPLLQGLETKSLAELAEVVAYFFRPRNPLQVKRAIAETVSLEVRIADDAQPGPRELRLDTPLGLSNPLRFEVGRWPEVVEPLPTLGEAAAVPVPTLPAVLNGQILPREVDRFAFTAKAGQALVLRVAARALIPYQADAVPGWMQATLTVTDAAGRELAFADDYRFDPDPVLLFRVPRDGRYAVEVRDALYRGREDFVYRLSVGEQPFVTHVTPLGGRAGAPASVSVHGWNLPWERQTLDTQAPGPELRRVAWDLGDARTNDVLYAVGDLPERAASEPDDLAQDAPTLALPALVNGAIDSPGDVDHVRFTGRAGEAVVVEASARVLGSPLDALLHLLDETGAVLAFGDDHPDATQGLLTHQADAYLSVRLPRDGAYVVRLSDAQRHGGPDHGYRLRVSAPRPDFALLATPSCVSVPAGRWAPLEVHVVRRDGFAGAIDLSLEGLPAGFALSGARVPPGRDRVVLTLAAPRDAGGARLPLRLRGTAKVQGRDVVRRATPADEVTQAFLYRHLVPAQEGLVAVLAAGARRASAVEPAAAEPVRLQPGGVAVTRLKATGLAALSGLSFALRDPPPGVSLGPARLVDGALALELRADAKAAVVGTAGNLLVEVSLAASSRGEAARPAQGALAFAVGVLPAVPFEIVAR